MRLAAQIVLVFLAADLAAFGVLLAVVWVAYARGRAADDIPRDTASFVAVGLGWLVAVAVVALGLWWLS